MQYVLVRDTVYAWSTGVRGGMLHMHSKQQGGGGRDWSRNLRARCSDSDDEFTPHTPGFDLCTCATTDYSNLVFAGAKKTDRIGIDLASLHLSLTIFFATELAVLIDRSRIQFCLWLYRLSMIWLRLAVLQFVLYYNYENNISR